MPDIAVIGAGAVGTVAASAAEQAGLDVVICARSPVSRPPARAFTELLEPSWLDLVEDSDFRTAAWRKMLSKVGANPVTALTGRRMGVLRDVEVRELVQILLGEAVAVGLAEGARLGPEDVAATMAFYDQFGDEDGTSMLYDRLAGRELEHEPISGAITRLGRRHGVPTPANQAMYALLGALARPEVAAEQAAGLGLPGSPG